MPRTIPILLALISIAAPTYADPTAGQLCESAMRLASGKYSQCMLTAAAKYSKTQDREQVNAAATKCATKLDSAFARATGKHGAACAATEASSEFAAFLQQCANDAALGTSGYPLPDYAGDLAACEACGNGSVDAGEACDGSDLNAETCATQGFAGGTLRCASGCTFDTSGCWATRWVDNGDGTATDRTTGLQWELKTDDGSVHDWTNKYTWQVAPGCGVLNPNGTVFTQFLPMLNGGVTGVGNCTESGGGFAGHCDWRLPTIVELQGILDVSAPGFTTIPGLTSADLYWSASAWSRGPGGAWVVLFRDASSTSANTNWLPVSSCGFSYYVRAVRGGS